MDYCIFDRNDVCTHDCGDCNAYKIKCAYCGAEEEVLYDINGEIMCTDCIIEEFGDEYYPAFAEALGEEFRDFIISANIRNRVYSPDHDLSDEDMY